MTEISRNLESISADARHHTALPPDWSIILVAYIDESTEATAQGRYSDVNSIGAACIMAVESALKLKEEEIPFIFAGNTATIVVLLEVYRLNAVDALLAFSRIVKIITSCLSWWDPCGDDSQKIKLQLEGLSCRWNKVSSKNHGHIMKILVYANPKVLGEVYDYVTGHIDSILTRGIDSANPTNIELVSTKSLFQLVREEKCFLAKLLSLTFIYRFFDIFVTVVDFKWELFLLGFFGIKQYKQAVRMHADYGKFYGMLCMVMDCKNQSKAIEFLPQDMHQHGQKLFYGVFYSTHSLMACMFDSSADGNHIHFIDCDNAGGYAMAAKKALKEQMQQDSSGQFVQHNPITQTLLEDNEEEALLDCCMPGGSNNNMLDTNVELGLSPCDDTVGPQFAAVMSFDDTDQHGAIAASISIMSPCLSRA